MAIVIGHGASDAQQCPHVRQVSKREMVGWEHRSVLSGKRPIASLNIGSLRRRSASLPSS
jgi:hypothetical protein